MKKSKTVIVGKSKPMLSYITACITIFNKGERSLMLRARGEAINKEVEVFQLLKNKFIGDVGIAKLSIDSETITTRQDKPRNLPVLEITLKRGSKVR